MDRSTQSTHIMSGNTVNFGRFQHQKNVPQSNITHYRYQRGLSLIIVMMFLSALMGISIYAVRQSVLSEGLARNQLDQEVARQAAEAALRDAERDIMTITPTTLTNASCTRGRDRPPIAADFTPTCITGLCLFSEERYAQTNWSARSSSTAEPWWPTGRGGLWNNTFSDKPGRTPLSTTNCSTFTGGVPLGTFTGTLPILGVAVQPEYIIEYFTRSSPVTYQPTKTYRITARGFGYTQRTQVVLQTFYVPLQE